MKLDGIHNINPRAISSLLDSYSRTARLYPALLTIAPIAWTVAVFLPGFITKDVAETILTAFVFFGGLTVLVSLARSRGKALEPRLISAWGGWRTTVLLRHSDNTIEKYTKARYHEKLVALCDGLALPSPNIEAQDPKDADERYRSATKRLIELRRDAKYGMLHKENGLYGFRRNLLGLKPLAIVITCLVMIVTGLIWWHGASLPMRTVDDVFSDLAARWQIYVVEALNVVYLVFWMSIVHQEFVRQAADEYATALFRTLE
jgi:hypothetical protein